MSKDIKQDIKQDMQHKDCSEDIEDLNKWAIQTAMNIVSDIYKYSKRPASAKYISLVLTTAGKLEKFVRASD